MLDNAPTYLTYLAAAFGIHGLNLDNPAHMQLFLAQYDHYLISVSLSSGWRYSLPVFIPIYGIVGLLFFSRFRLF